MFLSDLDMIQPHLSIWEVLAHPGCRNISPLPYFWWALCVYYYHEYLPFHSKGNASNIARATKKDAKILLFHLDPNPDFHDNVFLTLKPIHYTLICRCYLIVDIRTLHWVYTPPPISGEHLHIIFRDLAIWVSAIQIHRHNLFKVLI